MKKILIVDDVPGWLRFHKTNLEYLNIENIEIDTALCAKEAISKIESSIDEPYTTIFTDLQMESDFLPFMAGEWLVRQIKNYDKYYSATKVVIVSASPNIEQIAKRNEVLYCSKTVIRNAEAEIYRQFL